MFQPEYVCLSDVYMLDLSQVNFDLRCSVLFWIVLDPRTPSFQNISEGWLQDVEPPAEIILIWSVLALLRILYKKIRLFKITTPPKTQHPDQF